MDIGDHGPARRQRRAIGKLHTARLAALHGYAGHRAIGAHLPARLLDNAHHGADDGVRTTLAQRHAEGLVGHGFEVGKQRAARHVGAEVQVHAPGGHHRLQALVFEAGGEPAARAGHQHAQRLHAPGQTFRAPHRPDHTRQRPGRHRRAEQRKQMRRIDAKASLHGAPGVGITRVARGDPRAGRCKVGVHAEPAPVVEHRCKTMRCGQQRQAGRIQPRLVRRVKRRTREQAQVHGIQVVPETRQGDLGGPDRAAGHRSLLEHQHFPAFGAQVYGGRQPVVAGPDDDRVPGHGGAVANSAGSVISSSVRSALASASV